MPRRSPNVSSRGGALYVPAIFNLRFGRIRELTRGPADIWPAARCAPGRNANGPAYQVTYGRKEVAKEPFASFYEQSEPHDVTAADAFCRPKNRPILAICSFAHPQRNGSAGEQVSGRDVSTRSGITPT